MPLPTVILPGYLAGAAPYRGMEQALRVLGVCTVTVPLRWRDWIPTVGGRSVGPIIETLDATVKQVQAETGSDRLNLIGHSAGGWVARIYLGEAPYGVQSGDRPLPAPWKAHPHIATLLTLGTPHISQERWTKRNLDFVKDTYPGAFYPTVRYVCVAGKAIYGRRWRSGIAYNSYQLTCGTGECWGDGITPIVAAHLDGAENITLDHVWHSPKGDRPWYGSPEIVEAWSRYLI